MADDALFRELCKPEVLRLGWHLAQADSRNDFVTDPLRHEDLASNLALHLKHLLREISEERYRPRYVIEVDVPKSGLSVRPGTILPMEESSLLHAMTSLIAPRVDKFLPSNVHSYRLQRDWEKRVRKGRSMFRESEREIPFLKGTTLRKIDPMEPWYVAWPEFDRQRVALVRTKGFTHVTRADISAYFENIDLGLLEALLRKLLPREPRTISLLTRILSSWTRNTSAGVSVGRGLPQGNDVCSFLGNLYLIPLDRALTLFCRRTGAMWIRYVDDVEVYSKSDITAREVVLSINDSLRRLFLNMQGSKTEILSGSDLDAHVSSGRMALVNAAWKTVEKLNLEDAANRTKKRTVLSALRPIAAGYKRNLPRSAQRLNTQSGRILRRLFTIYGGMKEFGLRGVAFGVLAEPPSLQMLDKALRYLTQLPSRYHDQCVDDLLGLLESKAPLLPFHVGQILECIGDLHPTKGRLNIAGRVTVITGRRHAHWLVRQKALELLSVIPNRPETAMKRAINALEHNHQFVRRAGMIMLSRTDVVDFRRRVTTLQSDPDQAVAPVALLWHRQLYDRDVGLHEATKCLPKKVSDQAFMWTVNKLWVLRATVHPEVATVVRHVLSRFASSESAKVQWHLHELLRHTQWSTKAGLSAQGSASVIA